MLEKIIVLVTASIYMFPVSQEVKCYSRFDNGDCGDLLGEVTIEDCCLNPQYGYIGADGKCKFCG
jgi:hypothetical protein